jgi:predicted transcriptional regulator
MILKPTKPTMRIEDGRTIKTHPAFGQVSFSRVSGDSKLFGSEISSGTFIRCTIHESEEHWHLHQKWYYPDKIIAEFDLSPNQFAELLTTMNFRGGVPCTIRVKNNQSVEDFIDSETVHELIKEDIKQSSKDLSEEVKRLEKEMMEILDKSTLSKVSKKVLMDIVSSLKRTINDNMPFILTQYQEATDKIQSSAKAEVDAFVTHTITQLGLKKLGDLQKQIEE